MWIVPSKKVIGAGEAMAVSRTCFHSSVHSRERETASRSRSMSSFTPAIPSSVGIRASICRVTSSMWASVTSLTFLGEVTPMEGTPSFFEYQAIQSWTSRHWFVL